MYKNIPALRFQYGTSSISSSLIIQLKNIYKDGIIQLGTGKVRKQGINGFCDSAISAYPIAVAIWEAYLYETLLSTQNLNSNKESRIHSIPSDLIDKWDILTKSVVVPDLLYGKTFDKGAQPFQDFSKIVSIRNSIVHFKFDQPSKSVENVINDLTQRGIFLIQVPDKLDANSIYTIIWPHAVASTEAIRWCINTLYEMANMLETFLSLGNNNIPSLVSNFKKITEKDAEKLFEKLGVNPS